MVTVQESGQVPAAGRGQESGLRDQFVNREPGEQELPVSPVAVSAQLLGHGADHVVVHVDPLRAPGVEEALANEVLDGGGVVGNPDSVGGMSAVQGVQQRLAAGGLGDLGGRVARDGSTRADDDAPAG